MFQEAFPSLSPEPCYTQKLNIVHARGEKNRNPNMMIEIVVGDPPQ
jgi:hypothetical protein